MLNDVSRRTARAALRVPLIHRLYVRSWYELFTRGVKKDRRFMNYGYVPQNDDETVTVAPEDETNRNQVQMYHHIASQIDLRGLEVLEVGSGRGGGAAYVFTCFGPSRMVGLDIAEGSIQFCKKRYALPGLSFMQGDAENLKLPAQSFDAVLNIESAHHYGHIGRFLAEVARVLRPGGHLLFADCWPTRDLERLHQEFGTAGLELVKEEDITPNVMRALELDTPRKKASHERRARSRFLKPLLREFSNTAESRNYAQYRAGEMRFVCYLLRKPKAGNA
jgi:ubiquinone/menaquinone biosynthesis C-methylase UbiE